MLLNFYSHLGQGRGWSGSAEHIAVELEKRGFDVRVKSPKKSHVSSYTKDGLKLVDKPFKLGEIGIAYGFPAMFPMVTNKIKVGFSMFETDSLPRGNVNGLENSWAGYTGNPEDMCNLMDEIWTPCDHNNKVFKKAGVTKPIHKVLLGFNERMYFDMSQKRSEGRKDRPFTFLMAGELIMRKYPALAIAAFMELFKGRKDVKLIMKTMSGTLGHLYFPDDINIEVIDKMYKTSDMQDLYANSDCFLFPSAGEGFGLTPLEAMATGLPTIFSDNTGMSEYANSKYNYPIGWLRKDRAVRYPKDFGDYGSWYIPDYAMLKEKMLEVVNNQDLAREKGVEAAKWVKSKFTYSHTADTIIKRLNELTKNGNKLL